ncbi:MAG TPA: hypothetical protein PKB09_02510 [Candidatus Saccharibacteria bacterium]|nr:hypothetical protein [Candidatus Saccharibacteria bacterium]
MEPDDELETKKILVKIKRQSQGEEDEAVQLVFEKIDDNKDVEVDLSDSGVDDIKKLFDSVFTLINDSKQLLEFQLSDAENDLYFQVSQEVVSQLNTEVQESEAHFREIWNLTEELQED